ncbi:alpha-amylase-like [Tubulanus polymorphus]|uniref:alpha-amylase-like n=1 Tax=Tubulanus polymorphus TaxID=672921 RepID=UPI003DA55784
MLIGSLVYFVKKKIAEIRSKYIILTRKTNEFYTIVASDSVVKMSLTPGLVLLVLCFTSVWSAGNWRRTIIFVQIPKGSDNVFIRGGTSRPVCKPGDASKDPCAIAIKHNINPEYFSLSVKYSRWTKEDKYLDWWGPEFDQYAVRHLGEAAGTPLTPTTNVKPKGESKMWKDPTVKLYGFGYTPLNKYGDDYWMFDADVNCEQTIDGMFEFKVFMKDTGKWENDVHQTQCSGAKGGKQINSGNHVARCGMINVFHYNQDGCYYEAVPDIGV